MLKKDHRSTEDIKRNTNIRLALFEISFVQVTELNNQYDSLGVSFNERQGFKTDEIEPRICKPGSRCKSIIQTKLLELTRKCKYLLIYKTRKMLNLPHTHHIYVLSDEGV